VLSAKFLYGTLSSVPSAYILICK